MSRRAVIKKPKTGKNPAPSSTRDPVTREVLLAFWKVHILHHAEERPIYGQWIAEELSHHGYRISPGTLYPLLRRMEANGWLKGVTASGTAPHARKEYQLTKEGARVLAFLRTQVEELHHEVVEEAKEAASVMKGKHKH